MTTTFTALMNLCQFELGDILGAYWPRTTAIWQWCIEAMKVFPLSRPMRKDQTMAATGHSFSLPTDFKEIISVEYPINQSPPVYLSRMNEQDPAFYSTPERYDVLRDFADGVGYTLYLSDEVLINQHVYVNYLASHLVTGLLDDSVTTITIPDDHIHIIVAYVTAKAYRWMLGTNSMAPTAHSSIIMQMTDMVNKAEKRYNDLVAQVERNLVVSRPTPEKTMDKYDKVY